MVGSGKNRRNTGGVPEGQMSFDSLLWGPAVDEPETATVTATPLGAEEGEGNEPVRTAGPRALGEVAAEPAEPDRGPGELLHGVGRAGGDADRSAADRASGRRSGR